MKTDGGSEFVNKTFTTFLNNNEIKRYSRNTCLGAVFAERFDQTIRDRPKKPVFEKVMVIGLPY